MIILAFVISAAIGALGGIAITPINQTSYLSGGIYALSGFVAAVLGGWGSSTGAVVGGLACLGYRSIVGDRFSARRLSGRHRIRRTDPGPLLSTQWSAGSALR